jgi:hypothetical protein
MIDFENTQHGYTATQDATTPPPADIQAYLQQVVAGQGALKDLLKMLRRDMNFRSWSALTGGTPSTLPCRVTNVRCFLDLVHNPNAVPVNFQLNDGSIANKINTTLAPGGFLTQMSIEFTEWVELFSITGGTTLLFAGRIKW